MILLENVKKIYKAKSGDVTAVDNANLKIDKGEIFGVIGYSGAGKSSLIRFVQSVGETNFWPNYNCKSCHFSNYRKRTS